MICIIEFLYWEATGKQMDCKGKECRWYGGDTCHEKEKKIYLEGQKNNEEDYVINYCGNYGVCS